jgi:hypothetical protein
MITNMHKGSPALFLFVYAGSGSSSPPLSDPPFLSPSLSDPPFLSPSLPLSPSLSHERICVTCWEFGAGKEQKEHQLALDIHKDMYKP